MLVRIICLFLLISLNLESSIYGQNTEHKSDSSDIYNDLKIYAKRSKLTNFAYRMIFKSTEKNSKQGADLIHVAKNKNSRSYKKCEGKVIRKIHIETIDPFAYSLLHKKNSKQNVFIRVGNKAHIKSQLITIRNLLLIKQNQLFDSLIVNESERLVRSQEFVHDVEVSAERIVGSNDSVDIYIIVLDKWSIIPGFSSSKDRIKMQLIDKNIFGIGHEFENAVTWNRNLNRNGFKTNYVVPNINNTYISTNVHYEIDEFRYVNTSLNIDRPFFSPLTKWAAGINIRHQFNRDSIYYYQLEARTYQYKFNSRDYWIGRAWQVFKGQTENVRTTNLILSSRFKHINYIKLQNPFSDTLNLYLNENLFLTSLGISSRRYMQDSYIFGFGIIEDVPVGKVYGLTAGIQHRGGVLRPYIGLRYASGYYNKWGYIGGHVEYGTFFNKSFLEQGVITLSFEYFSKLLNIGHMKFRGFIRPQFLFGLHRFHFERVTLNEGSGLDGFSSSSLNGGNRFLINFLTQSYAPWQVFGFYFGPYLNYAMGMLSQSDSSFKKSKIYSQLAIGVLIKNEKLVFSSFQLSVSFFPIIPGVGQDIFKFNSFQTTNFGFRDFVIDKPYIASYK